MHQRNLVTLIALITTSSQFGNRVIGGAWRTNIKNIAANQLYESLVRDRICPYTYIRAQTFLIFHAQIL